MDPRSSTSAGLRVERLSPRSQALELEGELSDPYLPKIVAELFEPPAPLHPRRELLGGAPSSWPPPCVPSAAVTVVATPNRRP